MNYIDRIITSRFLKLKKQFPIVVLVGARQVGKTTFLKHVMKNEAEYIELDPVIDRYNTRSEPDLFLDNHPPPLILDEIQYAPELVSAIKRRVNRTSRKSQYILTGSQQWGVLKTMAESLAGRAAILEMQGFDMREACQVNHSPWICGYLANPDKFLGGSRDTFHPRYKMTEHIFRGSLPDANAIDLEVLHDFHSSYIRTYIERDVRLLADITDYFSFGRFFKLAGAMTAQEINFSQLGREISITPQTSRRWLDIMRATFQWLEVPAFSMNVMKRVSGKPKGYLTDSGIACFSLAISDHSALLSHPSWGAIFESFVVSDIVKQLGESGCHPNMYHWRTFAGAEVDLILELDGKIFPIEIKASSNPRPSDLSGIRAFRKTYPKLKIQKGIVVCPCEQINALSESDYAVPYNVF